MRHVRGCKDIVGRGSTRFHSGSLGSTSDDCGEAGKQSRTEEQTRTETNKEKDDTNDFEVGKIVYVCCPKRAVVVHYRVVEEVVRSTIGGKSVSYVLDNGSGTEKIELSSLEGTVFKTPDTARRELTKRAADAIDKLVNEAENKAASMLASSDT